MTQATFVRMFSFITLLAGLLTAQPTHAAADLVYVPVEPCRLVDTRATIGSIAADTSESFLAYGDAGDLSGQGGNAAGCPNPKPGSTPVSIAANVSAGGGCDERENGNLVAYRYGSTDCQSGQLQGWHQHR